MTYFTPVKPVPGDEPGPLRVAELVARLRRAPPDAIVKIYGFLPPSPSYNGEPTIIPADEISVDDDEVIISLNDSEAEIWR